jgi:hypothetical protein
MGATAALFAAVLANDGSTTNNEDTRQQRRGGGFVIGISALIRHSGFVIRHCRDELQQL